MSKSDAAAMAICEVKSILRPYLQELIHSQGHNKPSQESELQTFVVKKHTPYKPL